MYEVIGPSRPYQAERLALLANAEQCSLKTAEEYRLFEDFVSRSGRSSLGDGEAAAVALAKSRGYGVLTDDGPAISVVQSELSGTALTTVGLVGLAVETGAISEVEANEALRTALCDARMAVHDRDLLRLAQFVGDEPILEQWHLGDVAQRIAALRTGVNS